LAFKISVCNLQSVAVTNQLKLSMKKYSLFFLTAMWNIKILCLEKAQMF